MTDQKGNLIASNVDANNNELKKKRVFTFADLPICILEIIMSYLLLKDNICASAVCKVWRAAAESVRVVGKHPWIISFSDRGNLINLFDPLEQNMFTLNLPDIAGATVCYSKDGWLLMRRSSLVDMFFFNPYTRELINMPKCELSFHEIAFSSAPTSSTCTVIALESIKRYVIRLTILYPGTTEWITSEFYSLGIHPYEHSNFVYVNDHFYCFSANGVLLEFDLASKTPTHYEWGERSYPYIYNLKWSSQPKRMYLTEHKGVLILMYTYGDEAPMIYKLVTSGWEEVDTTTLNGLSIFASRYCSETRFDVLQMRNSVYFPKYGLRDKCCVSYSFDEGGYYPRKQLPKPTKRRRMQNELCPRMSLWIEPPSKDVLDLMNGESVIVRSNEQRNGKGDNLIN